MISRMFRGLLGGKGEAGSGVDGTSPGGGDCSGGAGSDGKSCGGNGSISSSTDGMRLSNSRLFTDIGLPGGMNGRQAAALARQQRPDLMVLFTTGCPGNVLPHGGMLDPGIISCKSHSPMPRWAQRSGPYWAVEIRMHAIIGQRRRDALPRI